MASIASHDCVSQFQYQAWAICRAPFELYWEGQDHAQIDEKRCKKPTLNSIIHRATLPAIRWLVPGDQWRAMPGSVLSLLSALRHFATTNSALSSTPPDHHNLVPSPFACHVKLPLLVRQVKLPMEIYNSELSAHYHHHPIIPIFANNSWTICLIIVKFCEIILLCNICNNNL